MKWFKKKAKWQVCTGNTVNKKWAKGVTVIDDLGFMPGTQCIEELKDEKPWKFRIYNKDSGWIFFNFSNAHERIIALNGLVNWIKEVQG